MCTKCESTIFNFSEQYLNSNLDELLIFDFTQYGQMMKRDCDRTPVVNAIYCVLYQQYFHFENCFWQSEPFSKYCGDTLNTYKSSFGNGPAGKQARKILEEDGDEKLFNLLQLFKSRYHSIGNFMPLPVKTINRISLNTGRNTAFNDYFDLFLMLIEDYYSLDEVAFIQKYENARSSIARLAQLIVLNRDYFNHFQTFQQYIDVNFLNSFYTARRYPLFNHSMEAVRFNDMNDIRSYLSNAIAIIEERSQAIVSALKINLNG